MICKDELGEPNENNLNDPLHDQGKFLYYI